MKEQQARTKVVLRHLPPSITEGILLEQIDSKFTGCYTWSSFRPGKASVKRQVPARAYINFKKPEDVYDFSEHLDGHVFVNEKGTQYKMTVEYAPYQRIPKPRSKKDIREGTIAKDPDYLDFLEMLGKPLEYLPSAEVQLERREAEKAASVGAGGGKETVVTPLMEFVRQRRAAKSAPQRSLNAKLASRSGVSVATSIAPHKRGLVRSGSGPMMDFKEMQPRDHTSGRREDQRKERDVMIERKRKEIAEAKEKKLLLGEVSSAPQSGVKGTATYHLLESSKEGTRVTVLTKDSSATETDGGSTANGVDGELSGSTVPVTAKSANEGLVGDGGKDLIKPHVLKRKQTLVIKEKLQKDNESGPQSPGQVSGGGYIQRYRPPVSPRVSSNSSAQSPLAVSGEGVSAAAPVSKLSQRREVSGRNSARGGLSPRDHHSPPNSSQITLLQDFHSQQQGSPQPADRVGKRPPRPQNVRMISKEQATSLAQSGESDQLGSSSSNSVPGEEKVESFSGSEKQDARRVRNKDRPDRPVWTPRRRSDTVQTADPSSALASAEVVPSEEKSETSKPDKSERNYQWQAGRAGSVSGQNSVESKVSEGAAGRQYVDGRRSHSGPASQAGKVRHIESSGNPRSARGSRSSVSGSNTPANQEQADVANQGAEQRSDAAVSSTVDPKTPQITLYNNRENGENHNSSSVVEKEKRKQDFTAQSIELTGGGHRRRERIVQHISRDNDGCVASAELAKPIKRSGGLALGSNEKQVWVAVQKSGSGT